MNITIDTAENDDMKRRARGPKTIIKNVVRVGASPPPRATLPSSTEGKKKLSSSPNAIYQRGRRASMSRDQYAAYRIKDSARKKEKKATMTEDQLVEGKRQNVKNVRAWRERNKKATMIPELHAEAKKTKASRERRDATR